MRFLFAGKQPRFSSQTAVAWLAFALNIFFVFNDLFPTLRGLNFWDEAVYINSGRLLVEGVLPSFARNPLIALLYAILYLPYLRAPLWMVYVAFWGRVVLFALLWWSCYFLIRELRVFTPPITAAGLLLVFPVLVDILVNPSDALFAAMSALALRKTLAFLNTSERRHARWGAFFVGLAALSRNDGLVLFPLFLLLLALIAWRQGLGWRWGWQAVLPFLALVGGYLLFYGARTGDFQLHTGERSYVAFLQGQSLDYHRDPSCQQKFLRCAVLEAERLYGSGEENDYSVIRAIARNPSAYARRLRKQVALMPEMVYAVLGERTAPLLFIMALAGAFDLLRRRRGLVLTVLLTWPLHLGIYFLTFFRYGYFRLPYFVAYALAAVGAATFAREVQRRRGFAWWALPLLAVSALAFLYDVRSLYLAAVPLLGVASALRLFSQHEARIDLQPIGLLALFVVGLMVRPVLNPPAPRDVTQEAEEQAVILLQKEFPSGSPVLAGSPGGVWAARMEFADANEYAQASSGEVLHERLIENGVVAVFVDPSLSNANEHVWNMIEPAIGKWYETLYSGREGSVRVLRVLP